MPKCLSVLFALTLVACGANSPSPVPLAGRTKSGSCLVEVRPTPWPIPLNEPFELTVELFDGVTGERSESQVFLEVDAWMPSHGHGMLRKTRVQQVEPGQYQVSGMLFHMEGEWELRIAIAQQQANGDFFQVVRDELALPIEL